MDLKLNRFLVASNVHLTSPNGSLDGAAVSDFLDFNRVYFIPVLTEPDRWTYLNGDFMHPQKGREMPGDTFAFPQLYGYHASLTSHSAVISAKNFVRFQGVTSYLFGAGVPLTTFYVNFGADPKLAQNSLSGASFDATWNFAGNSNSISAVHVRYDPTNHEYLSFEQHVASQNAYAVFSLNPATKQQKFWNLVTGDTFGERFQIRTFSQLYTDQTWLSEPNAAAMANYATATYAFPHSYLQGVWTQTYYNLLGPSSLTGPNAFNEGELNHPSSFQLSAVSFQNRIGHSPFYEQVRYGFGFNHDSYTEGIQPGLQQYGGYTYTTIWDHLFGFNVYTPGIKIGDHDNSYKWYTLNASFDEQRQWFSVPHYINTETTNMSLSRQFNHAFSAYLQYNIANSGDYYRNGLYVPYTPIINGVPVYSYSAFRGVATLRTTSLQMNYSTNPNFFASVLFRHHDDFPVPVPGLFPLPPTNVLGEYIYPSFLGQPPNDITAEVRGRVSDHIVLDVQRTYYFNFGTLRWSPNFIVQVSQ